MWGTSETACRASGCAYRSIISEAPRGRRSELRDPLQKIRGDLISYSCCRWTAGVRSFGRNYAAPSPAQVVITAWLDENCGADGWPMIPSRGCAGATMQCRSTSSTPPSRARSSRGSRRSRSCGRLHKASYVHPLPIAALSRPGFSISSDRPRARIRESSARVASRSHLRI
jgi:hypothetical protein